MKPVELIAYTDNPALADLFPILPAIQKMPAYYKSLKVSYKKGESAVENSLDYASTIRRCVGINQFNMDGYVVPLWSDYSILVNERGGVSCVGAGGNKADVHAPEQAMGALDPFFVVKLQSPWLLSCKEDVKFMYLANFYGANADNWNIPPGVVDYHNQTSTNIFVLVNKHQTPKEILLKAGTPLVRIMPMTERKVNFRIEVVDNLEKYAVKPPTFYFSNSVARLMKQRKENGQCPF